MEFIVIYSLNQTKHLSKNAVLQKLLNMYLDLSKPHFTIKMERPYISQNCHTQCVVCWYLQHLKTGSARTLFAFFARKATVNFSSMMERVRANQSMIATAPLGFLHLLRHLR